MPPARRRAGHRRIAGQPRTAAHRPIAARRRAAPHRRTVARPQGRRRRVLALVGALVVGLAPALVVEVAGAPPAAAATPAPGIDVANYQHPGGAPINWRQVRDSGVEFAVIKATEGPVGCTGAPYTNSWFRRDWADAGAVGLYRGAYHFARPGPVASAVAQARAFASVVGPLTGPRDLPPVLDLEVTCGLGPADLSTFAHAWVAEITRLTGRTPMIYTGFYFWKDHLHNDPSFSHLPLWIATYGPRPMVPPVWRSWTMWQYSSSGSVPGIVGAVDLNWMATGSAGLARLAEEGAGNPHGYLDDVDGGRGSLRVRGWTVDPDTTEPLDVHVYVDGVPRMAVRADALRPDVGVAFPSAGPSHGFDVEVPDVPDGDRQVCVWALNIGPGRPAVVGCGTARVSRAQPFGFLDGTDGGFGRVDVRGWAVDPDDLRRPVDVHVYVDGTLRAAAAADGSRPDVAVAHPDAGADHGFAIPVTGVAGGDRRVCTYAVNVAGHGGSELLGCATVRVHGGPPQGDVSRVVAGPGTLRITGWAIDQDTPDSIPVHVYVDGELRGGVLADGERLDVAWYLPPWGPRHGFDLTIPGLAPGGHRLCAYALDVAGGQPNSLLGCRDAHLPAGDPIGFLDAAAGGRGTATALGWALDPDTVDPVDVHVYVDGVPRVAARADRRRPDLLDADVAGFGADHGYAVEVPDVTPGDRRVCVYALERAGAGANRLLGCRTITVR